MEVRMEILIMKHCIACTLHVLYLETYWIVPCDSQYSYSSLFFRFEIHRNAVDYVLPSGTRQDSPTISDVVVGKQNCRRQQSKGVSLPRHRRRRPVPILEQTFLFLLLLNSSGEHWLFAPLVVFSWFFLDQMLANVSQSTLKKTETTGSGRSDRIQVSPSSDLIQPDPPPSVELDNAIRYKSSTRSSSSNNSVSSSLPSAGSRASARALIKPRKIMGIKNKVNSAPSVRDEDFKGSLGKIYSNHGDKGSIYLDENGNDPSIESPKWLQTYGTNPVAAMNNNSENNVSTLLDSQRMGQIRPFLNYSCVISHALKEFYQVSFEFEL